MLNLRMQEMLEEGEAIDISECLKDSEGNYILKEFIDGKDYCDAKKECWIWSIGQAKNGLIYASTDCRFYGNPKFKCLFLR